MNIPQEIERAIATELRKIEALSGVAVRCWRTPLDAPEVDASGNIILPMVGVTCETPSVSEQYQREALVLLLIATRAGDDPLRENVTAYEAAVIEFAEELDNSTHGYGTSDAFTAVQESLSNTVDALAASIERGALPQTIDGNHTSTVTIRISYQPKR
jgi:hypothetical protein